MFVLEKEAVMKNVVFGVLATLFIAGCGTVSRIDTDRAVSELPSSSDLELMLRKIENMKSISNSIDAMLTQDDGNRYRDDVRMISSETESLRKEADRFFLDLQAFKFKLEEAARSSVEQEDAEILARMHTLIIPKLEFSPSNTVKDAVHFFKQAADHPADGDALKFEFDLTGVVLGWSDDWEQRDGAHEEEDDNEKHDLRYKRLPIITAGDISFCDAMTLVFLSVDCRWDLRGGRVVVYRGSSWKDTLETQSYPAPLMNPDRDWISWLAAHDIQLPQGSLIVYDGRESKLHVTTSEEGFEKFRNAFHLIYSGDDK